MTQVASTLSRPAERTAGQDERAPSPEPLSSQKTPAAQAQPAPRRVLTCAELDLLS